MNKGRHACEQIFNDGVYWAWHPTLPSSTLAAQLLLSSGASLRPPPDRADEFPPLTARAALLVCLLVRSPAYSTGETAPMNPPTAKCCRLQHRHHHYQDVSLLLTTLLQLQERRAGRDCPRTFELPESGVQVCFASTFCAPSRPFSCLPAPPRAGECEAAGPRASICGRCRKMLTVKRGAYPSQESSQRPMTKQHSECILPHKIWESCSKERVCVSHPCTEST